MPNGCKYFIFNTKYECCNKYLYKSRKSIKRHCGFTHEKFRKPKDKKKTKYILVCHSCRDKAYIESEYVVVKNKSSKTQNSAKRSGVSSIVMESQGFGYQSGDQSFDAILMGSRGFGYYTGDPSFDDMLRRSRFG